jgi:hypothetical protein
VGIFCAHDVRRAVVRILVISVDGLNSVATSLLGLGPVPDSLWNRDQKLRAG